MRHAIPILLAISAVVAASLLTPSKAYAQELRLAAPSEMTQSGFLKHILPRFKLKHRITVTPVRPGAQADLAISTDANGPRVFADAHHSYHLHIRSPNPNQSPSSGATRFRDWLLSAPGKAAVESFPRGGPPTYSTQFDTSAPVEPIDVDGDASLGARLALLHCGRCHVVDARNRMGGIGSTPSFGAMRARDNWHALFSTYYLANPHPSFTEVIDVTQPFTDQNASHIAPVKLTLDDINAITAFVQAMPPKDLGRPVPSQ